MESNGYDRDGLDAALRAAEGSAARLAGGLVLPPGFLASLGSAIAIQIFTAALGIGVDETWARITLVAGVVVFGLVGLHQLMRFRRANGAWLGGLASRVVLGTATTASTIYVLAFGAAVWAALAEVWWLVALASLAGGVGYAVSGARWMDAYRGDPVGRGRGESALVLAALGLPAVVGLVLLVAGR